MSDFLSELGSEDFDLLRELGNIGAGNAVTSLAKMMGRKVDMKVPVANLKEFKDMAKIIGSEETLVFGVLVPISGEISGMMLLLVKVDSARTLINCLIGENKEYEENEEFSDMDRSAIQEIGNILSSAYINALSTLTNKTIIPSIPLLAMDMAGAILSVPAIEFGKVADKVLFVETIFEDDREKEVSGYFILVPEPESFNTMINSLGV